VSRHYLDHASTSPARPEVLDAMTPWLAHAADPSRMHTEAKAARVALEEARERVASWLGTRSRQVVFTSGGTESVNAATWGAAKARPGGPIVLAAVEHSSVRESSARMAPVVEVAVDGFGSISPDAVGEALDRISAGGDEAALVHCQLANHEVGTVQPATDVARLCRSRGVLCHVDAVAGAGHLPLDLAELGADLVSLSAHKLGGPLGVGVLAVRRGLRIEPLIVGGDQERARRGGIENVASIVGFGVLAELMRDPTFIRRESARAESQTAEIRELAASIDGVTNYGSPTQRLPHLVCVGVEGVEAEGVLLGLDQAGIAAHSGSACSSESLEPSPVLAAMGAEAARSLRVSVGWSTVQADLDALKRALPEVVTGLRSLRPEGQTI
jgi:cysteine desulfurase